MAKDFIAGCVGGLYQIYADGGHVVLVHGPPEAGCAGVLVGHPFDTVKVRLQTQSVTNPLYKGTIDCFASIIKQESVHGLYKGMASPLYGLAAINAIVFGVQGNVQRRLNNPDSLSSHFVAGSMAGAVQCIICSPMELAKTRMQIQGQGESSKYFRTHAHTYTGPVDCLRKIYRAEGIRGVYRGMGLTLMRECPSFGVYFAAYEVFCRGLAGGASDDDSDDAVLSTPALLLAGGCAGMCSWTSTYPADVIKSRLQADMNGRYSGMLDCARKSYQELGVGVFTRGLPSTLLRAFPVNATTFATVTLTLRYLHADQDDDGYYDYQLYARLNNPPHAKGSLGLVSNFPSHP